MPYVLAFDSPSEIVFRTYIWPISIAKKSSENQLRTCPRSLSKLPWWPPGYGIKAKPDQRWTSFPLGTLPVYACQHTTLFVGFFREYQRQMHVWTVWSLNEDPWPHADPSRQMNETARNEDPCSLLTNLHAGRSCYSLEPTNCSFKDYGKWWPSIDDGSHEGRPNRRMEWWIDYWRSSRSHKSGRYAGQRLWVVLS